MKKERNKKLLEWGLKLKVKNNKDNNIHYLSRERK
jgi:hypothetical protein